MSKNTANLYIKAHDHASKPLRGVGMSMKSFAKSAVGVAGLTFGIAGAAMGIKSLVSAASEAEEIGSKFDTVFGDQGKDALAFSNNLASAVGRSKTEIKKFMSNSQDMFKPMGFAGKDAMAMSQTVTKLGIDLASFNNKADSDVIRDLQSAMTGSHEVMKKYGVIINQTVMDEELKTMGIKKGMKAASEQQKVQARMNIIMRGTTDAQGDAERTSGSFANQMKALKSEFKDTATEAGQMLLPAMTKLIGGIRTGLKIGIVVGQNFGTIMQIAFLKMQLGLLSFWNDTKHFFGSTIPTLLTWFAGNWKDVFMTLWNGYKSILTNMYKNTTGFFKGVWSYLKGDGFDFKWTGLLDGFESTLKEMPKIAKRELGITEKHLGNQINGLNSELAAKFAAKLNPQAQSAGAGVTTAGMTAAQSKAATPAIAAGKGITSEARFLGRTQSKTDQTANNTKRLVRLQEQTLAVLKKQPENNSQPFNKKSIVIGNFK